MFYQRFCVKGNILKYIFGRRVGDKQYVICHVDYGRKHIFPGRSQKYNLPIFDLTKFVKDNIKEVPHVLVHIIEKLNRSTVCKSDINFKKVEKVYLSLVRFEPIPSLDSLELSQLLMLILRQIKQPLISYDILDELDKYDANTQQQCLSQFSKDYMNLTKIFAKNFSGRALLAKLLILFSDVAKKKCFEGSFLEISIRTSRYYVSGYQKCGWKLNCENVSRDIIVSHLLQHGSKQIEKIFNSHTFGGPKKDGHFNDEEEHEEGSEEKDNHAEESHDSEEHEDESEEKEHHADESHDSEEHEDESEEKEHHAEESHNSEEHEDESEEKEHHADESHDSAEHKKEPHEKDHHADESHDSAEHEKEPHQRDHHADESHREKKKKDDHSDHKEHGKSYNHS
ncbi:hypothetical protein HZS_6668 [Henneguya salminicola]|nr:hypothetical protein HZS_6668 [Henneguya salminicola]